MVDRMVDTYTDRYLGLMRNWGIRKNWKAIRIDGVDIMGRNR